MNLKKYLFLLGISTGAIFAAPQLQLATTAVGPLNIAPNTNAATITVPVSNIGTGSLSLGVFSSAAWLVPTVVNNATIQIAFNTAALSPGSYTEFVTVTSPGAVDAPQNISVTIQMGGLPATMQFYAVPVGAAVSQVVNTQSMATTQGTTTGGGQWLSVSLNAQGSFGFFIPYLVTATPQSGQGEGDYTGTATFSGSAVPADNKAIPVTLHLTNSPILQFGVSTAQLFSSAAGVKVSQAVNVSNIGNGTLNITGATGSATWLTAAVNGNSAITVTADPSGLVAGTYRGTVTLSSNAANAAANPLPVTLTVLGSAAPVINFGGVVDNAVGSGILAPSDIASIYGVLLSGQTPTSASSLPLLTSLAGVSVSVNGIAAPVYYTSTGQVNFLVPSQVQPGAGTVTISYNGVAGNTVSTKIVATAPKILRLGIGNYGIIVNNADNSFPIPVTPGLNSHPAKRGDALVIYSIGLGATTPAVADGAAAPGSEPLARTNIPDVMFGGGFTGAPANAQILFSGLTPGFVGLYQVNVIVPLDAPIGDLVGVQMILNEAVSNPVFVAISQ
jgi:uncharacterized protein (TIGR03437 family)